MFAYKMFANKNTMKKIFCFLISVLECVCLFAQSVNIPKVNSKFGNPTKEEMLMTVYEPDTTAAAVCLYKETEVYYEHLKVIVYNHKVRVKILKESGVSNANVSIAFYKGLEKLKAVAYNMENGKVVSTRMNNEQVFEEKISDSYVLTKFTIPQVKVGTVIEYEYKIVTYGRRDIIRQWQAQEAIPVRFALYDVIVPEIFIYNIENRGFERLDSEKSDATQSFSDGTYINACRYKFKGECLPAFKVEPFVWNEMDYCTQINFELKRVEVPKVDYVNISSNWEDVDEILYRHSKFGGLLSIENPFKAEMEQLNLDAKESDEEKICAIFQLLKSKIKWNENYRLLGRNMGNVLKEGSGSNADINFLLLRMLNDANIISAPVVINLRDRASISLIYPSVDNLSTFVVGVMKDSTLSYIDGSLSDGYLDVLPPVLMSKRARVLGENKSFWVDLQKIGQNSVRNTLQATLSPEGKIEGTRRVSYYGQFASELKKRYREAKDSLAFIQGLEDQHGVKFHLYSAKGLNEFSAKVIENSSFIKETEATADYIYVNPLLFMHVAEPLFTQSERKFPVEFDYPYDYHIRVNLTIPEGYSVDELPKSVNLVTEDRYMSLKYQVVHQGQKIAIKYELKIDEVFYLADKYNKVKQFWELVAEVNNSMLVLKKN